MTFIKMFGGMNASYCDWLMLNTEEGKMSSLWGDIDDTMGKNIFDPCPAGYRVPPSGEWVLPGISTGKDMTTPGEEGERGHYWKGNDEFYPMEGCTLAYQGYMVY